MKKYLVLWLLLFPSLATAQTEAAVKAALFLTGAGSEEELDERLVEELEALENRPLSLNQASRSRLLESGLFTPYQVATLEEYRSRSGDILSFAELQRVDGFGKEVVAVLRPFLSLESVRGAGEAVRDTLLVRQSALVRTTWKDAGAKYRISAGRFEAAGTWRPGGGTFYALYRLRKGKIMVGDYQARYGQGLAFWSAFQLSGLSTLQAFSKRAQGLTPSWSFTPGLRGLAWDCTLSHWQFALFGALDGTLGGHAGWLGRDAQGGLTVSRSCLSLDGKWNIRGVDLFGEAACRKGSGAVLAGSLFPLGAYWKGAVQFRALPSTYSGKRQGEYAAAAGLSFLSDNRLVRASWTLDAALLPLPQVNPGRSQVKSYLAAAWQVSENWLLESRLALRWRSYEESRTDLRFDATWKQSVWTVKGRLNGVWCAAPGVLGYLEGGWTPPLGGGWLRLTLFSTPDWTSRIYCYERDIPGYFTVPAQYGRGFSLMAYAHWKKRIRRTTLKLYVRGSWLCRKEKPGVTGLKVQLAAER